jgi:hypothetical protein
MGYSIIELVIAMLIAAIIIQTTLSSYSWFNKFYHQYIVSIKFTQSLNKVMMLITADTQNAGSFGSFNLHYLSKESISIYSNYNFCNIDNIIPGAGIYSSSNSITIVSGDNVGIYKNSLRNETIDNNCGSCESCALCQKDSQLFLNNSIFENNNYILASAVTLFTSSNRLYLCRTQDINPKYSRINMANPANSSIDSNSEISFNLSECNHSGIAVESYERLQGDDNDTIMQPSLPNIQTFAVMNFKAIEYYVTSVSGISGLYYRELMPNCTKFSQPILIAPEVEALSISYNILNSNGLISNTTILDSQQSYNKILGVTINISAKYQESIVTMSSYVGF